MSSPVDAPDITALAWIWLDSSLAVDDINTVLANRACARSRARRTLRRHSVTCDVARRVVVVVVVVVDVHRHFWVCALEGPQWLLAVRERLAHF